jgi:xanthine/CO dehydrogenase XdhC/CoxF family maturation factor
MEVIDSGVPRLVSFGISDEMGWEVGLSCGGTIEVFVEPLNAGAQSAA